MMRRFHGAALAAVVAVGFASSSFAADMPAKGPVYKAPVAAPVYSWTGVYIGVNGGYAGTGNREVTFTPNDPLAALGCLGVGGGACTRPSSANLRGGFGGIQVGYNLQFGRNWLLGVETDFNGSGIRGSGTAAPFQFIGGSTANFTTEQDIKWFGTVRARLGYLPTESLLFYATGGFAYARVDESAVLNSTGGAANSGGFGANCTLGAGTLPVCFTGASSRTAAGWTAGGGLEFAVWRNLSLKAEYLYVGLPGRSVTVTAINGAGAIPASFSANFGRSDFQLARLGLNYRF